MPLGAPGPPWRAGGRRAFGRTSQSWRVRDGCGVAHHFLLGKSVPSQYRYKAPYKANPLPENPDATSASFTFGSATANPHELIVVRPTTPLGAAFTSRMVRNRGAGLLEDSPTRASPEPQVRPLAPCFTVRSPDRDMSPDIRPMCLGAPGFRSGSLIVDALESRRAHRAHLPGTATTHFSPNRPQITTLGPTSLQGWAAKTSPLTVRRVVLAPPSCGSSFRGTSSLATCRVRSPSCSEEIYT